MVGQDREMQLPESLRRRLAVCPDCREYYQSLSECMQVLQRAGLRDEVEPGKSLWPELSQRLPRNESSRPSPAKSPRRARSPRERTDYISGWIAATAVACACLAIFITPLTMPREGPVARSPVVVPSHLISLEQRAPEREGRDRQYELELQRERLLRELERSRIYDLDL